MLVINYSGNKPQCDRFKFSVNGDNNSQTIKFVLKKQQGDIDLSSPLFSIYFLCQSQDKRFVDKAEIESFVVEGNDIILEYKLLGKHTQFKAIDVGLSFEDENQEVVYKTASATISIQNGIMADQTMANLYPSIINQHTREINNLKSGKVNVYEILGLTILDTDFIEKLNVGDLVVVDDGTTKITYIVNDFDIDAGVKRLCRVENNRVIIVKYIFDDEWHFATKNIIPFGGQGLVFDKQYIFTDNGVEIVEQVPEDYTGNSYWFGSDAFFYIERYVNGNLVSQTEISYDNININDIHFTDKATVWEVEDDPNDLGDWLNENADKLKVGDIIFSEPYGETLNTIRKNNYEIAFGFTDYDDKKIVEYIYQFDSESGWIIALEGTTKIGFDQAIASHSIIELYPSEREILHNAIDDAFNNGVSCSQVDWNGIKNLLDASLFLTLDNNIYMAKTFTSNISYVFGSTGAGQPPNIGGTLEIYYDADNQLLFAEYNEI